MSDPQTHPDDKVPTKKLKLSKENNQTTIKDFESFKTTKILPDETWLKIFYYLPTSDILLNVARVSIHFNELAKDSVHEITLNFLSLKRFHQDNGDPYEYHSIIKDINKTIQNSKYLKKLSFQKIGIDKDDQEIMDKVVNTALEFCPRFSQIEWGSSIIFSYATGYFLNRDIFMKIVEKGQNIQSLKFSEIPICQIQNENDNTTYCILEEASNLTKLRHLTIENCCICSNCLIAFGDSLKNLESFTYKNELHKDNPFHEEHGNLNPEDIITTIANWKIDNLTDLTFIFNGYWNNDHMNKHWFRYLSKLTKLKKLVLKNIGFDVKEIETSGIIGYKFENLCHLELNGWYCADSHSDILPSLFENNNLEHLKYLKIVMKYPYRWIVTTHKEIFEIKPLYNKVVKAIALGCPKLEFLHLPEYSEGSEPMKFLIKYCRSLRILSLAMYRNNIMELQNLNIVSMEGSKMGFDLITEIINELPKLSILYLREERGHLKLDSSYEVLNDISQLGSINERKFSELKIVQPFNKNDILIPKIEPLLLQ